MAFLYIILWTEGKEREWGWRGSKIWARQLCSVSGCNPQAPQAGHGQLAIYQNRRAATLQSVGGAGRTREKCGGTGSFGGIGNIPDPRKRSANRLR